MPAISIQPGIIPQCKDLSHGAIAAATLSHMIKALLKGSEDSISLSDLATMTASKLDDTESGIEIDGFEEPAQAEQEAEPEVSDDAE